MRLAIAAAVVAAAACLSPARAAMAQPTYAIAMHGTPALPEDFAHFPYVNPNAPKGGRIDYAVPGTFDSLNPFIVQGEAARGLFDSEFGYNVFESLMARSRDEAFTLYPLIARTVETDPDRTFVQFTLDPRARFSDGTPITPEDVIFSMKLLRDKARPLYQGWLDRVAKMEIVGKDGVRFDFKPGADRELPLLIALLPILPEHATDAANFDKSTLKPMIGSGPYVVAAVRPGESVVLKRNPHYWARNLPSKVGFDNYDEIHIDYYRSASARFESFTKGLSDIYFEGDPVRWKTAYDFPAVEDGRVVKETFANKLPSGMFGFVLNTRRRVFRSLAVRRALAGLFDFNWVNRNLFADAYVRTKSYFDGSALSSYGHPESAAERALLKKFPNAVAPEMAAGTYRPPVSDGTGRDRKFLRKGYDELVAAGYEIRNEHMIGPDGRPLAFEIMLSGTAGEGVAMAWQRELGKLGITVRVRPVDSAQYQQRLQTYDYDCILQSYYSSLSPGGEQVGRWGSRSRDAPGTFNFAGVADPAIDALISDFVHARTEDEFITAVRAFDRVLLSGYYVVPLYHQPEQWVAHWARIEHPAVTPIYGYQLPTWWYDEK